MAIKFSYSEFNQFFYTSRESPFFELQRKLLVSSKQVTRKTSSAGYELAGIR
jgi:hypothetical protein